MLRGLSGAFTSGVVQGESPVNADVPASPESSEEVGFRLNARI